MSKDNTSSGALTEAAIKQYLPPGHNKGGNRIYEKDQLAYTRLRALSLSIDGLEYLAKVFKDENEPTKVRMKAVDMIMNRGLGRPIQAIQIEDSRTEKPKMMSTEQLKEELELLKTDRNIIEMKLNKDEPPTPTV